ncbi:MAG TPA: universal stress protein, partial [Ideonella sp.]|nr:universal stress protein [Ideonella sp.]
AAEQKARLVLLNVVDDYPILAEMAPAVNYEEGRRRLLLRGEQVLKDAGSLAAEAGVPCEGVLREVTAERTADAIVEESKKRGCDLIVMGTHGRRGFNRLAMGSDAELVLRLTPVPLLLVRAEEQRG